MTLYVVDISNHKPNFDVGRAVAEGYSAVIAKASEGADYADPTFLGFMAAARAAGVPFAGYVYQRADSTPAQHVQVLRELGVPTDCPMIVDVEANSGTVGLTRALVAELRAAGYRVPLVYLPRWYWQSIGSPDLTGLPPLWSSSYPGSVQRAGAAMYADAGGTGGSGWAGYGGNTVRLWQFSSTATVANYNAIDVSAFEGDEAELRALLGGQGEDDFLMALEQWQQERIFDRILSMSQGVEGQNFNGAQFDAEQRQRDRIEGYLVKLTADLTDAEATLLGAIKSIPTNQPPQDLAVLAAAYAATLPAGVTLEQLADALKSSTNPTT
jgi:lysozyme